MDDLAPDRLNADTLVEDYNWDEEQAEESGGRVAGQWVRRRLGRGPIAESIHRLSEDED